MNETIKQKIQELNELIQKTDLDDFLDDTQGVELAIEILDRHNGLSSACSRLYKHFFSCLICNAVEDLHRGLLDTEILKRIETLVSEERKGTQQ